MRRPRVVVYVTREHPLTGADQLLIFEHPELPGLHCPAGGIEAGETPEQAAAREVQEETGLKGIAIVRKVGYAEQPGRLEPRFLHESQFLHAEPTVETPEEWEHEGVAVRWEPVRADLPLWPPHRAFLDALVRKRVVAYVTREHGGCNELLVFDHRGMPEVPTQVPAGRIDAHETLEEGVLREVEEETGLTDVRIAAELADADEFTQLFGPSAHRSWAFHAVAKAGGPDKWEHSVSGTGMDAGLVFLCRWVPLDACPPLWGKADPLVEKLRRSITKP
jgi:ADP-ribose pyrophosphatase YjhB (NUDIX family)